MIDQFPEMHELLCRMEQSEIRARDAEARLERTEHRQKSLSYFLLLVAFGGSLLFSRIPATSQTSTQLQAQITAIQNTLQFLSTTGTTMTISGANLIINNGAGSTATSNGLGNLTIGYNETGNTNSDTRTGSHNLVLGSQNSFSSWAGIVAGSNNTISNTFACVEGGFGNRASGAYSNIGGGYQNLASANSTYVGGGGQNTASGPGASITGGNSNVASGGSSAISGGYANVASGSSTYVGGGENNTALGSASSVTGGYGNQASAASSAVTGGASNLASGTNSIVIGGNGNQASASYGVVPLDANTSSIATINTSITGINTSVGTINSSLSTINTTLTNDGGAIAELQAFSSTANTNITALQFATQFITAGKDVNGYWATFISGCNLWVQSGSGSTNDGGTLTGLGNLIIGYNETGNAIGDTRNGSHNLVVGAKNDYSNFGGVVFGQNNSISGGYGTVLGGYGNELVGVLSSILGGEFNLAYTEYSTGCVSWFRQCTPVPYLAVPIV